MAMIVTVSPLVFVRLTAVPSELPTGTLPNDTAVRDATRSFGSTMTRSSAADDDRCGSSPVAAVEPGSTAHAAPKRERRRASAFVFFDMVGAPEGEPMTL